MNTITLQNNRRPLFKTSGNPIGENTENIAFNVPKSAFKVLNDFCRNQNRSDFIRRAVAEKIQRANTWAGLAFRAACRLSNEASAAIRSIFTPGSPEEKAAAFKAAVEVEKIEAGNRTDLGGAKPIADSVREFEAPENFIAKGGLK